MLDLGRLLLYKRRMKFYARLECVAVEAKRKGEGLKGMRTFNSPALPSPPHCSPVLILILIVDRTRGKLGMARSQRPDPDPDSRFNPPTLNWTTLLQGYHFIILLQHGLCAHRPLVDLLHHIHCPSRYLLLSTFRPPVK